MAAVSTRSSRQSRRSRPVDGVRSRTNTHSPWLRDDLRDLRANPPRYSKVAKDLRIYDTDGHGHVVCGLYRRRLDEGRIWTSGDYARHSPKCP
jgi:hypothetical protein